MNRSARILLICTGAIVLASAGAAHPGNGGQTNTNPNVAVEIRLSRKEFKPGDKGELAVKLIPAAGFHVNANPAVEVRLSDTGDLILRGEPSQTIEKKSGYLSSRTPVRQPIAIPVTASRGRHTLKGTVTYFYCSDAEGWCQRYRQPVTISFSVTK